MWVVIIGGTFGIVTLLAKALIDLGSKTNRQRAAISADVDLLKAIPDELESTRAVLRRRIERHLIAYAAVPRADFNVPPDGRGPDGSTSATPPVAQEAWRGVVMRGLMVLSTIGVVLASSGGVAAIGDLVPTDLDWLSAESVAVVTATLAAVIGTIIPMIAGRIASNHREAEFEAELERQIAELHADADAVSDNRSS